MKTSFMWHCTEHILRDPFCKEGTLHQIQMDGSVMKASLAKLACLQFGTYWIYLMYDKVQRRI